MNLGLSHENNTPQDGARRRFQLDAIGTSIHYILESAHTYTCIMDIIMHLTCCVSESET